MFPEYDIKLIKNWLKPPDANVAYNYLRYNIKWQDTLKNLEGKEVKIKRKMAYVGPGNIYEYNGLQLAITQGNFVLAEIWWQLTQYGYSYIDNKDSPEYKLININSVLLNMYETGRDEIRWHQDRETQLSPNPVIACVNLGWGRNFWFMNKETGEKIPYWVENGDLLVMGEDCQQKYLHAILKESNAKPRISLTFRKVTEK